MLPLHWGFWPDGGSPAPVAANDPVLAFSEALLAFVPDDVGRIMDVGCGLGFNTKLLAARGKRVTAVSPIAHHCAAITDAALPGVDVRCGRFEQLAPDAPYDLLLFSEWANHFALDTAFLEHCARFLRPGGYVLLADDLTERARGWSSAARLRMLRTRDITANVAPTGEWWTSHMRLGAAYYDALVAIIRLHDPAVAARVQEIIAPLRDGDLSLLLPPSPRRRRGAT